MVKKREKKNKLIVWLTNRYELIVRNEADFAERRTMTFTYAQVLFSLFCVFALMMGGSLLLSKTLLSRWFNPEYEFNKLKYDISELAEETDKLERELVLKDSFIMTIKKRFDPEYVQTTSQSVGGGIDSKGQSNKEILDLVHTNQEPLNLTQEVLVFPVDGVYVSRKDTATIGSKALLLELEVDDNLKAIKEGKVELTTWDKDYGYVMMINHGNRLKTVYNGVGVLLKKPGEYVTSGEVIGLSGKCYNGPKSLVRFEMWHNNAALDIENYFIIKK